MGDASAITNTFTTPNPAKTIKLTTSANATHTANTATNTDSKAPIDPGDWDRYRFD
jgi:hypothetical protein